MTLASPAFAADFCDPDDPQASWDDLTSATCMGVCTLIGSNTVFQCDLTANDDNSAPYYNAWAVAVFDHNGDICGAGDYCIWGTDVEDNEFRCSVDPGTYTNLSQVTIIGGTDDDSIYFTFDDTAVTFNLTDHDDTPFTGLAQGMNGDDLIIGSRDAGGDYTDDLKGNIGDDDICGREGDDLISGNEGNDQLAGEDGNDTVNGNDDTDQVCGNGGNDTVLGGAGNGDQVQSDNSGGDTVSGGPGTGDACTGDGDPTCESTGLDAVCDIVF